jgi:methylmalonyl-CoA mutase
MRALTVLSPLVPSPLVPPEGTVGRRGLDSPSLSAVEELAFAVAIGVAALRRFAVDGLTVSDVAEEILFMLRPGGDFFLDVVKIRAARLLWSKVTRAACGKGMGMVVHVRASRTLAQTEDPWDHLLRSATESFAATVGGAESVVAAVPAGRVDRRRLAISALHVLEEEAHLARVLDPAGGSYYVEKLTEETARDAWKLFQKLEAVGGMKAALEDGTVDKIYRAAAAREEEEGGGR